MPRSILRASDYQTADDIARKISAQESNALSDAIFDALQHYSAEIDPDKLLEAIATGAAGSVLAAVSLDRLSAQLADAFGEIDRIYAKAAAAEAKAINLPFDPTATAGVDLSSYTAEIVADIRQASEAGIAQAANSALQRGLPLDEVAGVVRDVIGLTDRQAQAVLNFRLALEEGRPSIDQALNGTAWALRDRRFDPTLERIAAGEDVDQATIDKMVAQYASRQLAFRANTIAQTEAMRVANAGVRDNYALAVGRGVFAASAITRFWQVDLTEGTCLLCLSIPAMNPNGVGFDAPFESIEGPVMEPIEDTHPVCRCSIRYAIAAWAMPVPASEEAAA